ncbi:hypothetical protein R3I94_022726 [Phoxinus phoxinus]
MAAPVIPAKGTPEIPVLATKPALKTISAITVSKLLVISVWSTLSQKFPSLPPHRPGVPVMAVWSEKFLSWTPQRFKCQNSSSGA